MYDTLVTGTSVGTVTLDSGSYGNYLTLTTTGIVRGTGTIGGAVSADASGVSLSNAGSIYGADAKMSVVLGYYLGPAARRIYTDRYVDYSVAQDGVSLAGAQFTNSGYIVGGTGPSAGSDGAGIYLISSTGLNEGVIEGGAAWGALIGYTVGSNGDAAPGGALVAGYFKNAGIVEGGEGRSGLSISPNRNAGSDGAQGGDGITMSGAAILDNTGLIEGGSGGQGNVGGTSASEQWISFGGGSGGIGGTGVYLNSGTVINTGRIAGGSGGAGGSGNGQAAGATGQEGTGVIIQNGLLINDGTIEGGNDAVSFTGSGTLQIDEGGVFDGVVQADSAARDMLVLAGDNGGTIWIGSQFLDFTNLDLAAATSWTIEGNLEALSTLTITGLSSTDTLELYGITAATLGYVSGNDLEINSGTNSVVLPIVGGLNGANLTVAPCFCPGTQIRTPRGEIRVEDLQIGDEVVTAFSGIQRIRWIGRRSYEGAVLTDNHLALPVCIKAGAIADNIPCRDLWVSPDHAIAEAGVLIPAWRLVNGRTIILAQNVKRVSYIHIEFDKHQIVFAENCATETFRDADCRDRFENASEYEHLYGRSQPVASCLPLAEGGFHLHNIQSRLASRAGLKIVELPPGPLHGNLDELGPEWVRGWAQDLSAPEQPVQLEVISRGTIIAKVLANSYRGDLRHAGLGSGCHAFHLRVPKSVDSVQFRRSVDGAILGNHVNQISR